MSDEQTCASEQWRERIAAQAGSGQSIAAYCREHGLRAWQFYEWKKRLAPGAESPFVAVSVKAESTRIGHTPTASSSVIELRHRHGWSLQIEVGFDAAHLRRLLSVLEAVS